MSFEEYENIFLDIPEYYIEAEKFIKENTVSKYKDSGHEAAKKLIVKYLFETKERVFKYHKDLFFVEMNNLFLDSRFKNCNNSKYLLLKFKEIHLNIVVVKRNRRK